MGYYIKRFFNLKNILILSVVLIAIASLVMGIIFLNNKEYYNISATQLQEMLGLENGDLYGEEDIANFQFVDVRTKDEYDGTAIGSIAHISDFTINLDYYEFRDDTILLEQLSTKYPVVLICRSGNRSEKAAKILVDYGFEKVYNVKGGITAYDELD